MWHVDQSKPGIAVWRDRHGSWSIDAAGGVSGIRIVDGDLTADTVKSNASEWMRLDLVENTSLPELGEQFVRGSGLHLYYPQGQGIFGVRLVIEPVRSTPENLILELTVAIQTTLLDSHPKLDVIIDGGAVRSLTVDDLADAGGSPPICVSQGDATVAVLLGRHDAPFTSDLSTGDQIKLRLFGDFLEKGVIRKARPWLVIDRGGEIGDPQLRRVWRELSQSPLPLTP